MKAIWKGQTLAESDATVVVEGNHYFPLGSIEEAFFKESPTRTTCPWKGEASYFSIVVAGEINEDAAWYYPSPKDAAKEIAGHIAFWRGVEITDR